jgi:branched-chain amino acid transport system permease protein
MIAEGIRRHWLALVVSVIVIAALALAPSFLPPFETRVGALFLFSAGLAVAWTLLGGFAGYWSFGHTAFIGLGAFAAALSEAALHLRPPLLSMAAGVLIAALVCAVLAALLAWPILRLRGIYFAIAMLGVAQVLAELNNNIDMFGGSLGIVLPRVVLRGVPQPTLYFEIFLGLGSIILLIGFLVKISRLGYGLVSLREDEDTARMLGVPTEPMKIVVFVLSAALTGMLGAVYAHSLGYITTSSVYRTDFSLDMIVYSLLGGMGTLLGPVLGALLMVVLTQIVLGQLLDIHMFITGAVLVALVLVAPRGILGVFIDARRRRAPAGP